jgi:site-specific recombinase XerD
MARRCRHDPRLGGLRRDRRHQGRRAHDRGRRRPLLPFQDAEARHLAKTTLQKRRELLEGKLLPFCKDQGLSHLKQLDVATLRTFRNGWAYSALSAVKRLEYLRSFLRSCLDSGWIEHNAAQVLKPPKVTQRPTLPFDEGEMKRILAAADR